MHSRQDLIRISLAKTFEKVYGLHITLAWGHNSPDASSMWFDEQMMGHSGVILVIPSIIPIMVIM